MVKASSQALDVRLRTPSPSRTHSQGHPQATHNIMPV